MDPKSGVFQAMTAGSTMLRIGFVGVMAAMLVTVGNAGGVGSTVAGVARVPFVVGIDRYLPAAFGRIHPKWKTPYVAILVQAFATGVILLAEADQRNGPNSAYQESGGRGDDRLFYSVHVHVRGGDPAGVSQRSRGEPKMRS